VRIGAGSIVDPGSVVTEDLPDHVAAAGVPARVWREGVTWDRRRRPSAEQIRARFATG
jgi:acetyltransferase-like isoleucine patch superfamily enzyme